MAAKKTTKKTTTARQARAATKKAVGKPSRSRKCKPKVDTTGWRTKMLDKRIKFDDEQKDIYCKVLADTGMKGAAANAADVCRETARRHMKEDPLFASRVDDAIDDYRDKWVTHATNLAYEGVPKVFYDKDGNVRAEQKDYPIRLIELELKRVEPGYREKQDINLTHGGGVLIAPPDISPADWLEQQRKIEEARDKENKS